MTEGVNEGGDRSVAGPSGGRVGVGWDWLVLFGFGGEGWKAAGPGGGAWVGIGRDESCVARWGHWTPFGRRAGERPATRSGWGLGLLESGGA